MTTTPTNIKNVRMTLPLAFPAKKHCGYPPGVALVVPLGPAPKGHPTGARCIKRVAIREPTAGFSNFQLSRLHLAFFIEESAL
ncbi:MAG: hypothetical protein ACP5O1_04745 [Phycisphaerae bacterium]